ncbi:MAG: hypothetical protein V4647_11305 [Pseudomonadota bacterium]
MNAPHLTFGSLRPRRTPERPTLDRTAMGASATSMRWSALGDAGTVVAALAGVQPETPGRALRNFPVLIRDCPPWRRQLADNMVADLAAMMEPGIAALLAVNARGADPRPAARALWHEFSLARAAVLALLPPTGAWVRRAWPDCALKARALKASRAVDHVPLSFQ